MYISYSRLAIPRQPFPATSLTITLHDIYIEFNLELMKFSSAYGMDKPAMYSNGKPQASYLGTKASFNGVNTPLPSG